MTVLEFSVKASSDAHILLAPCDGCDGYEVVIGGRNNGLYLVSIYIYIVPFIFVCEADLEVLMLSVS